MTKFFSTILTFALLFIGSLFFASPAQASESETKTPVCQATTNGHHLINPAKNSLITGNGSISGINADDVVPPFDYDFGGNDYGHFSGHNWPSEEIGTAFMAGCAGASHDLTPALAKPTVQATCVNSIGIAPASPVQTDSRISAGEAVLGDGVWTITYTKPENITHNTPVTFESFNWADPKFTGVQTITIIPAGPGDEYWDDKKGECNLPETGAGGISNTALMFGGGAIGLGMIFLGVSSIMKRRES